MDDLARERGQQAARQMNDLDLVKAYAQGAEAFALGAWDILDAEVTRRGRVRLEALWRSSTDTSSSTRSADETDGISVGLMEGLGASILVLGIIGLVWVAMQDTSVPTEFGRVSNLSLMEQKRTYMAMVGVVTIVGALLFGFGRLQRDRS